MVFAATRCIDNHTCLSAFTEGDSNGAGGTPRPRHTTPSLMDDPVRLPTEAVITVSDEECSSLPTARSRQGISGRQPSKLKPRAGDGVVCDQAVGGGVLQNEAAATGIGKALDTRMAGSSCEGIADYNPKTPVKVDRAASTPQCSDEYALGTSATTTPSHMIRSTPSTISVLKVGHRIR